jgi:hypothetical protein
VVGGIVDLVGHYSGSFFLSSHFLELIELSGRRTNERITISELFPWYLSIVLGWK